MAWMPPITMRTIARVFIPSNFAYTANQLGYTTNGVQVEVDVHLEQPGINAAEAAKILINIFQKRLMDTFHFPQVDSICSILRAHAPGAEHLAYGNTIWVGQPPFTQADVPVVAHQIAALWICEAVELFAHATQRGWESTLAHGEALSRFIGETFIPNGLNAAGIQSVPTWLNAPGRPDWISKAANTETDPVPIGCAMAFLHYLRDVLKFPLDQITQAAGPHLEAKYEFLTKKKGGYAAMMAVINKKFPPGKPVANTMPMDSPFLFA